jgi:DNA-binding transcriptional LysR family regulator
MDNCEAYFASGRGSDQKLSVMLTRGIVNEFADVPIAEFRDRNPEIYLDLFQADDMDCEDALDTFKADLSITAGPLDENKYEAERVHTSRYGIVVHKNDPIALQKTADIRDLEGRPLTVMWERHKTLSVLNAAAKAAGIELSIKSRVDNALLIFQNAHNRQSTGIAAGTLMSRFSKLDLCFIPFSDPAISWNVYLVSRKGYERSHAALVFSEYVRWHRDSLLMN